MPLQVVSCKKNFGLKTAYFICTDILNKCYRTLCGLFTWYLLVELKGISEILLYCSLMPPTEPQHSSIHFSKAASEASPATSLCGFKQRVGSVGLRQVVEFFFDNILYTKTDITEIRKCLIHWEWSRNIDSSNQKNNFYKKLAIINLTERQYFTGLSARFYKLLLKTSIPQKDIYIFQIFGSLVYNKKSVLPHFILLPLCSLRKKYGKLVGTH